MNGHIFPNHVKAFYTNLSYNNGVINSSIRGKSFVFDAEDLGKFLDIPSEGLEFRMNKTIALKYYVQRDFYYGIGRKIEHEVFQKRKKKLCGKLPDRSSWFVGNLYIDDRIFNYLLTYIIVPRSINHSTITDTVVQILFVIKNGLPINWAFMILEHVGSHDEFALELP